MGRRGPRSRPTELRLVEGADPSKVNRHEPKPRPLDPEPPDDLAPDVLDVWDYTLEQLRGMKLSFAADRDALVAFCEAVVMHRRASALLAKSQVLVQGMHGGLVRNPAVQIQRDAAAVIRAFAQEFGLTPSARAGIKADKGAAGDGDRNPFAPSAEG